MMFDDINADMRVNIPAQPASALITQSRDHEASNPLGVCPPNISFMSANCEH